MTKGKTNGTGLGLVIAHKIVTDHGGKIRCASSATGGKWVEFLVTFPAAT